MSLASCTATFIFPDNLRLMLYQTRNRKSVADTPHMLRHPFGISGSSLCYCVPSETPKVTSITWQQARQGHQLRRRIPPFATHCPRLRRNGHLNPPSPYPDFFAPN